MDKDWLLKTLETRFNENMHRHENLKWENVLQKLETQPKKLELLEKWKILVANRMWLVLMKNQVNFYSSIVQLKVRKSGAAIATTEKLWTNEKKTSPKIMFWMPPKI